MWQRTNQHHQQRNPVRAGGIGPSKSAHRGRRTDCVPMADPSPHQHTPPAQPAPNNNRTRSPPRQSDDSSQPAVEVPKPQRALWHQSRGIGPGGRDCEETVEEPATASALRTADSAGRRPRRETRTTRPSQPPGGPNSMFRPDTARDTPSSPPPAAHPPRRATVCDYLMLVARCS